MFFISRYALPKCFRKMNNPIVQNLRNQVQVLTQERNNFRRELREETRENQNLRQVFVNVRRRCRQLQQSNDDLQTENDNLNQQVLDLNNQIQNDRPRIFHKLWENVGKQTKKKRKAEYTGLFSSVLDKIPECKKAKVDLKLGHDRLSLKWSCEDMQNKRDALRANGHRFRNPVILPSDESDSDNDNAANAKKEKRQSVVSLMDEFKLSQRGYHEFRYLVSKKAPPINQIRTERVIMSGLIPYIKHPTVNNLHVFLKKPITKKSNYFHIKQTKLIDRF